MFNCYFMWQLERGEISKETGNLHWEDCKEKIDVVALASKEPILFYDEVGILADNFNIYRLCLGRHVCTYILFLICIPAMTKLILVTEQVVLYEDELADSGVSLLTVKVVSH